MEKIDKFFLIIFLTLQTNFFDFINIRNTILNNFASYSQKKLLLFLILTYVFIRIFTLHQTKISDQKITRNFMIFFLIVYFFAWLIVFVGTVTQYQQSIWSTFLNSYYFFIMVLFIPYSKILDTWEKWIDFTKIVLFFSTILALSKILQSFFLSKYNLLVFYLNTRNDFNTATQLRFMTLGFTRIPSATDFVFFSILLMFVVMSYRQAFLSRAKIFTILFVNLFYLIAVGQTRSYIVLTALLIIVYVTISIFKKIGAGGGVVIGTMLIVPIIYALIFFLENLILNNESRAISLTVRQEAIDYYLHNLNFSGIFAFGFLRDDLYGTLIHGVDLKGLLLGYNYDDVGIVGFLGMFGITGIVVLLVYLICLVQAFIYSKRKHITIMVYIFIVGSCASLSLFDPQRIFYLPVMLAMVCFLTSSNSVYMETK